MYGDKRGKDIVVASLLRYRESNQIHRISELNSNHCLEKVLVTYAWRQSAPAGASCPFSTDCDFCVWLELVIGQC